MSDKYIIDASGISEDSMYGCMDGWMDGWMDGI